MSRWQQLSKLLGLAAEDVAKLSPETLSTLERVATPEISTALKGSDRAKYLQALDEAYGNQDARAKVMGFGDETYYHGTGVDFDEFNLSKLNRDANAHFNTKPIYATKSPSTASEYAQEAADSQDVDDLVNKFEKEYKSLPKSEQTSKLWTDGINKIYDNSGQGVGENVIPLKIRGSSISFNGADKIKKSGMTVPEYYDLVEDNTMNQVAIKNPNQVRSKFAAFDPRFKDSAKLLAGAGAIPGANMDLGNQIKQFGEDIAEPVVDRYQKLKSMFTGPLAKQLDLTKDKSATEDLKTGLDIGLDPTNLMGPVSGGAAALFELFGTKNDKQKGK